MNFVAVTVKRSRLAGKPKWFDGVLRNDGRGYYVLSKESNHSHQIDMRIQAHQREQRMK